MFDRSSVPDAIFQSFTQQSDPSKVAARVAALKEKFSQAGVNGFLIPRTDVHQGEYVPASEARLAYLTGFTGSSGLAFVGTDISALFVDSRYTLQAPLQTDTDIFTIVDTTYTQPSAWLAENISENTVIGYDAWMHTADQIDQLRSALNAANITLKPISNILDETWSDRPAAPEGLVEVLGDNRTGQSTTDKISMVRAQMQAQKADALVLTLPESICWLFNIRGRDVPHNPFVLAFAVVPADGAPVLFVDASKITDENTIALSSVAELQDKSTFSTALADIAASGNVVWYDPATAPDILRSILANSTSKPVTLRDPVALPKARKNEVELAGMREAHKIDGIAMVRFLAWFDKAVAQGGLTEIDVVKKLEYFRRDNPSSVDISFDTISGSGENGAIVHYRVTEETNRVITPGELMLVDSGGQYLSGTTDITRTMATGSVTAEQKDNFTRVLKGMIAISRVRFPRGTTGAQIDILARQFLWQSGQTYNHGTGHGVGAFLSVHEGPIGIASKYTVPFEPGMVVSNEPGIYITGEYGIRIENLITVRESDINEGFLEFETLTLAPIDRRLINVAMLETGEREWLNAYHERVREEIGPSVAGDNRAWLEKATQPL